MSNDKGSYFYDGHWYGLNKKKLGAIQDKIDRLFEVLSRRYPDLNLVDFKNSEVILYNQVKLIARATGYSDVDAFLANYGFKIVDKKADEKVEIDSKVRSNGNNIEEKPKVEIDSKPVLEESKPKIDNKSIYKKINTTDVVIPEAKVLPNAYGYVDFTYATEDEIGPEHNPCEDEAAFLDGSFVRKFQCTYQEVYFKYENDNEVLFYQTQEYNDDYDYQNCAETPNVVDEVRAKLLEEINEGRHSYQGYPIKEVIFRDKSCMNASVYDDIRYAIKEDKKYYYNSSYDEMYSRLDDFTFLYRDEIYNLITKKKYFRYGAIDTVTDLFIDYEDEAYSEYRRDYIFSGAYESIDSYLNEEFFWNEYTYWYEFGEHDVLDTPIGELVNRLDEIDTQLTIKDVSYKDDTSSDRVEFNEAYSIDKLTNKEKYKLYTEGAYLISNIECLYAYNKFLACNRCDYPHIEDIYNIEDEPEYIHPPYPLYGKRTYSQALEFNTVKFVMGHVSGYNPVISKDLTVEALMTLFLAEGALKLRYDKDGLYCGIFVESDDLFCMRIDIDGYEKYGLNEEDVARDYRMQVEFDAVDDKHYLYHMYLAKTECANLKIIDHKRKTNPKRFNKLVKDVNDYCFKHYGYYMTNK